MCKESNKKLQSSISTKEDHNYFINEPDIATEEMICTETEELFVTSSSSRERQKLEKDITPAAQQCLFCTKTFNSKYALNKHMKTHEDNTNLICKVLLLRMYIFTALL